MRRSTERALKAYVILQIVAGPIWAVLCGQHCWYCASHVRDGFNPVHLLRCADRAVAIETQKRRN